MGQDNSKQANRLVQEKSPYLLQHAYNPVDWYPWSDEAFDRARLEDKPIFLSIGYSTCHWCHVMEQESFEDEEVAALLNRNFISIKVDREERPDLDQLYMAACQAFTGQGGWPLTVIMTDDSEKAAQNLKLIGLEACFDPVLGCDLVKNCKPAPDLVLEACSRLGISPAEAAVIGDTTADMQMGRAAGAACCIGVASGVTAPEALAAGADIVLKRPA